MKILCISDTHNTFPDIDNINADIIIHSGDFTNSGTEDETFTFLKWYKNLHFAKKILIAGNHDFYCESYPNKIAGFCTENKINYLCDSGISINNLYFWGAPWVPYCGNHAFVKYDYEIKIHWSLIPQNTDILITHGPPYGILSSVLRNDREIDFGCPSLKQTVQLIKPKFHIFGHIHQAQGIYKDNHTTYVNCATGCYIVSI